MNPIIHAILIAAATVAVVLLAYFIGWHEGYQYGKESRKGK